MVDIVVDQKPMPQNRVDPDVKIPDSVRRRSAAVDALYQQPSQSEPPAVTPSVPSPQPAALESPSPPEPPQPPAAEPDPNQLQLPGIEKPAAPEKVVSGSDQNQLDALRGRLAAREKLLGEMQEQLEQMGTELAYYQQRGNGQQQPQRQQPASYLTADDEKNFGADLLDVAIRAARHGLGPELQRLHEENQQLRTEMNRAAKTGTDQYLDTHVKDWRTINTDSRFHQWLLLPDPYSGIIRDRLLKDAALAANAPRVASFFKGYLAEVAATGQAEPSHNPPPVKPPREAAVPLASLAAPGRERPSNGGIPPSPADKPTYTRADIERFHRMYMRGQIPEADYERLSRDLVLAGKEGRVIG